MDIDHRKDHADKFAPVAKEISKRVREDGKVKVTRKRKVAEKIRTQRIVLAAAANAPDWRFVLIDYRNENQHIKAKMMTHYEAACKNNLLRGSGFAWAKCA